MSSLFFHRFDAQYRSRRYDLLLAYLAGDALDEAEFRDAVNFHIDRDLIPDEILLLVREPLAHSLIERFTTSETLRALKQRLQDKATISIRPFQVDGKQQDPILVHGNYAVPLRAEVLIRRVVTRIVTDRHGFIEAAGNYHFALPSQRHTERFIRISKILVESSEISFIALGLLPFIHKDVSVVYVDTPALFPIVSALSDHLRAFNPGRPPLFAENFHSYSGYESIRYAVDSRNVVLISASSSGSLAKRILGIAQFNPNQLIHLLYLGPQTDQRPVVCDLEFDAQHNPDGLRSYPQDFKAGACSLCDANSPVVPIVGDHFDLPGPQPIPLVIRRDDVSARLRELMERLVGHNVMSVGFGRANEPIARQFEISPKALISSLQRSKRLPYVLTQAIPARVGAIVCLNTQSLPLARRVRKHVETLSAAVAPPIIMPDQLSLLDSTHDINAFVIVAAVVESGRSLQDVSRDLRRPFPKAPQIYVIGLAKYRTDSLYDRLKSDLVQAHGAIPHEFNAIERIQLPSSSEPNSWIAELRLLNEPKFFNKMTNRERKDWAARRERLTKQSAPLTDDLFVSAKVDAPMRLQSGFALWPDDLADRDASQADVYFTIASVLQNRRAAHETGSGRALRTDLFQQTILDPNNFGRFSDGVIQASILRAARPNELNYAWAPEYSRDMARIARRMILSSDRPRGEAAAELLIALGTKRLRLCANDCKEVLKEADHLPPRVEWLRQVVTVVLAEDGVFA
jgi:hypothetical protein